MARTHAHQAALDAAAQRQQAHQWEFRVEDRGFDAAICDKYADLFASDELLRSAHEQYKRSVESINARMTQIAKEVEAQKAGHYPVSV